MLNVASSVTDFKTCIWHQAFLAETSKKAKIDFFGSKY